MTCDSNRIRTFPKPVIVSPKLICSLRVLLPTTLALWGRIRGLLPDVNTFEGLRARGQ
jgi:hypothetical protein